MPLNPDDPWLTHIPQLHRILAGGEPAFAHPRVPHGDAIHGSCAYWEPLYYLLNTILGWRDLGRGLAWWYTNGRPVDDPRLALIQSIWDSEGQLAYFAAWAIGDPTPESIHVDAAKRHVVLVTHDFNTWRGELQSAGRQLPPLAHDRSWHVDVFDKRVGWLGTYRQSRVTGRWFTGKHSVHIAGQ